MLRWLAALSGSTQLPATLERQVAEAYAADSVRLGTCIARGAQAKHAQEQAARLRAQEAQLAATQHQCHARIQSIEGLSVSILVVGFTCGAQAKHAQEQAARLRAQEAQLAAMKRQLEAMQAASAGRAPRRDRDGRAPVEYICPITQVLPAAI